MAVPRTPPARRKFRAFTLIELLVVIAIIAILAGILFPVFARARGKAQQTSCLSNEKQIGTALFAYLQDNDDAFPMNRFLDTKEPNGQSRNWRDAIYSFISNKDVMKCPTNAESNKYPRTAEESGLYPISYALNGSVFNEYAYTTGGAQRTGYQPVRLSQVKDPSGTLFVLESRLPAPDLSVDHLDVSRYYFDQPGGKGVFQTHDGRTNMLYADGHVRSVKLAETLAPTPMWQDARYTQTDYNALTGQLAKEYR